MSILAAMVVPHPPIILPEVGHGEEKKIQHTIDAYREVAKRAAALKPDTLVITSPHSILYADYFHISPGRTASGTFANFRAPQVKITVNYDTEFVNTLSELAASSSIYAGTLGERNAELDHGTLIPLRFMEQAGIDFNETKVVRIGLSGLSAAEHYKLGQLIAETADKLNRRVVYIASGDLSHKLKSDGPYGFVEEGSVFDKEVMEHISDGDFLSMLRMDNNLCKKAAECGLRSFWIMAGALDKKAVKCEQLSYEGTFGVGYGVAWIDINGDDANRNIGEQLIEANHKALAEIKSNEDEFVKLARLSLETFVKTHSKLDNLPSNLPDEMTERRAGAFVSLHKDGELRGCIGTFLPTTASIAEEIVQNAVSACSRDPRFSPVTVSELDDIVYNVDILSEPERIFDTKQLDVKRYGVIVEKDGRRGLLLPDLEGVDTVEQQIAIAKQKGNIAPKEKVNLWRFEVVRHR